MSSKPKGGKKVPLAVDRYVGQRIRARRIELEISQTALAKEIGVTFQQVQKYEKGHNRVAPSRLDRIAKLLHVPMAYFFDGMPGSADTQAAERENSVGGEFFADPGGFRLARAYLMMPRDVRASMVTFAENIGRDIRDRAPNWK